MKTSRLAAGIQMLLVVLLCAMAVPKASCEPTPPGGQAEHLKVIGFSSLGGRYGAFKTAIKHTKDDKWYLYLGHSFDQGWSIVDVSDPENPRYVKFIPFTTDNPKIITSQVTLHDDLMLTSLNTFAPQKNPLPAVLLWDIKDPENPKQVGSWQGGDIGAHRNTYPGGKYAFLSTSYPGYRGYIMVVLDVSDPAHPKEVGKWAQPGQKNDEPQVDGPLGFHGPLMLSPDGKRAVLPYAPDMVNLDLSDPSKPTLLGRLKLTPPFTCIEDGHNPPYGAQSVHSVLPMWDRQLVYVSSEARKTQCKDIGVQLCGLVDNKDMAHPHLLSLFPTPRPPQGAAYRNFCEKGGRFGPHNTNQETHNPAVQQPGNLIYVAYFNAGLRIFDIRDPQLPSEVAYYMPPERPEAPLKGGVHADPINWSEEVAVDARGNIYLNDDKWGLFVLRYTGDVPVSLSNADNHRCCGL
jgi:hypothetical protein